MIASLIVSNKTVWLQYSINGIICKLTAEKEKDQLNRAGLLAAELGFEPRQTESESVVLPLHNSAMS